MFWWFYKTWFRKTTNLFIKTWFGISNAVKHVSIHINTNTKVQLIIFSRSVLLLYDHVFVSPKHGFIIQVCVWDTEMTKLFFKTWFWDLWYMILFTTHQLFYTTIHHTTPNCGLNNAVRKVSQSEKFYSDDDDDDDNNEMNHVFLIMCVWA